MLYLATPTGPDAVDAMIRGELGMIDTPRQGSRTLKDHAHTHRVTWAADNGCYSERWDPGRWWAWLNSDEKAAHRDSCLFATAPDVVADAAATWERSRPWLPRIRAAGYPVAYVAQDGLTDLPWDDLDVLFIGGSTAWKLGAEARRWITRAVTRGIPVHMGRVNSLKRYAYAAQLGCTTADGTFLKHGVDIRLPELLSWPAQTSRIAAVPALLTHADV